MFNVSDEIRQRVSKMQNRVNGPWTVERIEEELSRIDAAIAALKVERLGVQRLDLEYAGYLDHYQAYYDDDPLDIRHYYAYSAQLSELNQLIMSEEDPEKFEALFIKHMPEIAKLERLLGA